MNRLGTASSPYLLQHRENPVEWWEWGPAAFAAARQLNRPVLLSVGYAACHWCHVMAHESFEDPDVAAVMNELFVNIKVDREERPDVDHVYMSALQLLGEQGGWPLTMFLTPNGEPFWGGTYFPKEPRFGRPGFVQLLREVARVFQSEPDRVAHNQSLIKKSLLETAQKNVRHGGSLGLGELDRIGAALMEAIDSDNGGLRGAPKFPNPSILEFLLRYAHRNASKTVLNAFILTLERMALGGIHDQIGGGFARYSVDERWHVPHFEKMLYDNAQLLELYALAAHDTGRTLFRSAAEGIVTWLEREMATPEGGFASSLDADSEGEEGRFYVWDLREIEDVLGEDAALFARVYDVSQAGNWEQTNVLNRLVSGEAAPHVEERLRDMRARLLAHRAGRERPGIDDKILADWNGLTIAALVRAGMILDRPDWIALAQRAYAFVSGTMSRDGRLGHSYRDGTLIYPGFALDHAAMMRAGLSLFEATATASYLDDAQRWRDVLMRDYLVTETGLLAMTAKDAGRLLIRPQPSHDDAVPNANGVFADALVRLAQLTGADADRVLAESALETLVGIAQTAPVGHTSILNALDLHLRGLTVVISGEGSDALASDALVEAALHLPYLERTVCRLAHDGHLDVNHPAHAAVLEAQAEGLGSGKGARALACSGMRCSLPVREPLALLRQAHEMLNDRAADSDKEMAEHRPGHC